MDYSLPGSSVHGILQARYWSGLPCPPPGDLGDSGSKPVSSALTGRFFTTKPPGKPKNTGVGSLSLLQWIFLTKELNQDLLHCRQILYHLSHQGSNYTHTTPKTKDHKTNIMEIYQGKPQRSKLKPSISLRNSMFLLGSVFK